MWRRSLALALLFGFGVAGLAARPASAQELDSCSDLRAGPGGIRGCVRIEEFNFADPVLLRNSYHLLGSNATFIVYSNMRMEVLPLPEGTRAASRSWSAGTGR